MKRLPLYNRKNEVVGEALVDDTDYGWLSQWTWRRNSCGYAVRGKVINGRYTLIFMHRAIMGMPPSEGLEVDHKNRNRLDNRRGNLRWVTDQESVCNRQRWSNSGWRGVHKEGNKYHAQISVGGRTQSLGYHNTDVAAALAYDAVARTLPGGRRLLNFP